MPHYVPSKIEQFEELLNNLLVRLDALEAKLDDETITATLILLTIQLFRKLDFVQREIDLLNDFGVPLDKIHDVYQPLHEFIQNNEDIKEELLEIYMNKVNEYRGQMPVRGGKRRKLTRRRKVNRRKTRGRRVRKGRKN